MKTLRIPRRTTVNPVLALVGAIVLIDAFADQTISRVLRRNRGEAVVALAWLIVHIAKEDKTVVILKEDTTVRLIDTAVRIMEENE